MMSNNKILTVSYGTFSCTLEGFDDSFDTMRAIAEYFRDLAADDRYFGAEPPQPDAEMLARIAEREIARRVEAHLSDQGVHLRAGDKMAALTASDAPFGSSDTPIDGAASDARPAEPVTQTGSETGASTEVRTAPEQPATDHGQRTDDEASATEAATRHPPAQETPVARHASITQTSVGYTMFAMANFPAAAAQPAATPQPEVEQTQPQPESSTGPAAESESLPTDDDDAARFFAQGVAEPDIPVAEDIPPSEARPIPNSISDKLRRIRAVVSKTHEPKAAYSEDEHAEAFLEEEEAETVQQMAEFFTPDADEVHEHVPAAEAEPDAHRDDADMAPEFEASVETEIESASLLEPEAAGKSEVETANEVESPDEAEIDPANAIELEADIEPASAAENEDADTSALDAGEAQLHGTDAETETEAASDNETATAPATLPESDETISDEDAELAATLARLSQDHDATDTADAARAWDDADNVEVQSTEDAQAAEAIGEDDGEDEAADAEFDFKGLFEDKDDADHDPAEEAGIEAESETELSVDLHAVRARVLMLKRSDVEAALAAHATSTPEAEQVEPEQAEIGLAGTELDEIDTAADHAAAVDTETDATVAVSDETAEPVVEHASVETETDAVATEDTDAVAADETEDDSLDATEEGATAPLAHEPNDTSADEEELDRLMAEADSQMHEPESSSRRATFDKLRGVVAARNADDELDHEDGADEDPYRTDLAAAVTPRRPVATARTDRPRDQRPAPLKLVAEQRIDVPSASTGPVRPRRVAAETEKPASADDSFADYAAARGAHDLPDLLEAAASYLSFVEGLDQFSRPQLMTKVRQLDPESFTREDGLRHFGQLLRSGKIEKIKGGRFTVSDDIGFRPDGERAAG